MNVMTRTRIDLAANGVDIGRLRLAVDLAARSVPPLWPLDGAIAVNPLTGFEALPFEEALRAGAARFGARATLALDQWRRLSAAGNPGRAAVRDAAIAQLGGMEDAFRLLGPNVSLLDCLMARLFDLPAPTTPTNSRDPVADAVADLCAAFFDAGTAAVPIAGRERGLLAATRDLLPHMPGLRTHRLPLPDLPDRPIVALAALVAMHGVSEAAIDDFLASTIARLPGWAGHIRWRVDHAEPALVRGAPAGMADLAALLLLGDLAAPAIPIIERGADPAAIRTALAGHFGLSASAMGGLADLVATLDEADLGLIFQRAAETAYRDALVDRISRKAAEPDADGSTALLFCIDVRSEPMRRAIEARGPYHTLGYAGFFGLPIALGQPGAVRRHQLPVLVAPQHDLAMVAPPAAIAAAHRSRAASRLFGWLKGGSATAFATAEATGLLAAATMLGDTLAPAAMRKLRRRWQGHAHDAAPSIDRHDHCPGLDHAARLAYARALFALTGLDRATPLVVLVGHAGEAVNNPYASALDCGACAGHGGAPNARAMAMILNDPAVRAELRLPQDGYALAAEHNTTTDDITLFGAADAPDALRDRIASLVDDLVKAGAVVRAERAVKLARDPSDLARGAAHWGEVRPEWGLTSNAAFIVASRGRTRGIDLQGRAFLHSYDWQSDAEGEALATILTAPMVVAQWINCQYLFSTIDNERYGAGDKTIHNPVGRIGVVRGNGGDLAVGLPRQSLFDDDGLTAHVPQRLLTIVEAPLDRVAAVVDAHPVLQRLFGNGWVQLVAIDPVTGLVRRWRSDTELRARAWSSNPNNNPEQ